MSVDLFVTDEAVVLIPKKRSKRRACGIRRHVTRLREVLRQEEKALRDRQNSGNKPTRVIEHAQRFHTAKQFASRIGRNFTPDRKLEPKPAYRHNRSAA
jgi:hypothetical protein